MAKKETTTVPTTKKQSMLKSPMLPWAIIVIALSVALGFAIGWHTKHNMEQAIDSKASQLANMKVAEQESKTEAVEQ